MYKGRVMVMRLINLILGMVRKGSAAAVDNEYKTTNQPGPGSEAGRRHSAGIIRRHLCKYCVIAPLINRNKPGDK